MPGVADASILDSTKKILGLASDYTAFDPDIITHINSTFFTLNQLGIGPLDGYMIEGSEEKWSDYLGANINLNSVRTYMYAKVRMLFDPPTTSFAIAALEKVISEQEWRLNVKRENDVHPLIEEGIPVNE